MGNWIYFLMGVISSVLTLAIVGNRESLYKVATKKPWSKIEKVEYTFDVDHKFDKQLNAQEVLYVLNEIMRIRIETNCAHMKKIVIEPADYSVNYVTTVRLTQRKSDE